MIVKHDASEKNGSHETSEVSKKRPHDEVAEQNGGGPSRTSNGDSSAATQGKMASPIDDDEDDMGSELEEEDPFPVSHEIVLKDHTKVGAPHPARVLVRADLLGPPQVLSAMSLDPSGARLATGSHDYDVKIWDFGGMDSRLKPFKSFEPCESYPVRRAYWPGQQSAQTRFIIRSTTSCSPPTARVS